MARMYNIPELGELSENLAERLDQMRLLFREYEGDERRTCGLEQHEMEIRNALALSSFREETTTFVIDEDFYPHVDLHFDSSVRPRNQRPRYA